MPLRLRPEDPVSPSLGEALSELPHHRVVRRMLEKAEEGCKSMLFKGLSLEFVVTETVLMLDKELDHRSLIGGVRHPCRCRYDTWPLYV